MWREDGVGGGSISVASSWAGHWLSSLWIGRTRHVSGPSPRSRWYTGATWLVSGRRSTDSPGARLASRSSEPVALACFSEGRRNDGRLGDGFLDAEGSNRGALADMMSLVAVADGH